MTIKNVAQANTQFAANLKAGRSTIDKSHVALVWGILNAVDTQDLSQLDTMRALVAEEWPALRSRFDAYMLATLDNVTLKAGVFTDDGELFALSDCAVLATSWNTRAKLGSRDIKAPKLLDPRADLTRTINKVNKGGLVEALNTKQQLVADVLAKAKADIEAIAAGTYAVPAKPVKSTPANVARITKAA